ncbi:hypothetical protein QWY86_09705 [Pedobacter aquatilis]|uniref:hypothetical protein n=1 Tax=Pedobacter aquatilis TaxID=351343 RepID=UPI0025B3C14B|nr:hypothetical protein [Pedobacter aquatilis]MDN3586943.1 hypothetical protein [Pedobacter aquatilis]
MENQLTNNANALRLFFTDDVFLVEDNSVVMQASEASKLVLASEVDSLAGVKNDTNQAKESGLNDVIQSNEVKNYAENVVNTAILEEPLQPKNFKFLGGNKKSVLILVHDDTNPVSTEQGRELLRKIVKAIDLSTPDFALLNYASYADADFSELNSFFKPKLLLAFGIQTNHLKLDLIWAGEVITHQNTRMIFAPNLHDLDADVAAKKKLWANLQIIK